MKISHRVNIFSGARGTAYVCRWSKSLSVGGVTVYCLKKTELFVLWLESIHHSLDVHIKPTVRKDCKPQSCKCADSNLRRRRLRDITLDREKLVEPRKHSLQPIGK